MVPPEGSSTDQITDWLTIPLTTARNWTSWPGPTSDDDGLTATAMAGDAGVEVQAESPARRAIPATPRVLESMREQYPDGPPGAAASRAEGGRRAFPFSRRGAAT